MELSALSRCFHLAYLACTERGRFKDYSRSTRSLLRVLIARLVYAQPRLRKSLRPPSTLFVSRGFVSIAQALVLSEPTLFLGALWIPHRRNNTAMEGLLGSEEARGAG